MSTDFNFTLILVGDAEPHLDALYDAGCDDATFGSIDGTHYAEFDRSASTLGEALSSAIRDVERTGLRVARIEPDDLVTMAEVAARLGRSRESVRLLISGARGPGGFPAPITHTRERSRLWRLSDVLSWADVASAEERSAAHLIAATNAALELRAQSAALEPATREALQRLARAA